MAGGSELVGATLGAYQVEALIGRGGMGDVYRARDTTLGRAVALKVLPPELLGSADRVARFTREARAASALNHPHLVAIYEIREAVPVRDGASLSVPPVHYLAMELVTGETLRAAFESRRLNLKHALDLLAQIAEALAAAHAAGIVHRDLKPENMMVSDGGYAKVLDFGLAKLRSDLADHGLAEQPTVAPATSPGMLLGTVGYMSPEQAQGLQVDHRSDIFSFGCVLYEAATGTRAFSGPSAIDTLHRIVNAEPKWSGSGLRETPAELQRIVGKCLAKDPDERYQSIKEAAIDLRLFLRRLESASDAGIAAVTSAGGRWRGAAVWIGVTAAAVAVAAGWFALKPLAPTPAAAPTEISIERLTASGIVIDAAISPDGKYLAYVESTGGRQSLWVRQIDGTNPLQLDPPRQGGYWGIAFSRDSESVFFAFKSGQDPGGSLYHVPLIGGERRKLLAGIDSSVTFSPDGRQLAYFRVDYPERGDSALMVAGIDGANPRALTTHRPPEFLAPGFFVAPSWSPDGTQIVAPLRNSSTRNAKLVGVQMDGTERAIGSAFARIAFTEWLSDGSGIVFIGRGEALSADRGGQIWLQPYPSGPARRLTSDLIDYRNAWVSGDGQTIISVGQDVSPVLWSIPLDGKSEPRKIPSLRYDGIVGVATLPDGRILFTSPVRGDQQIWVMDADGSNRRVLTRDGVSAWPQPAPDGSFIAFAGGRKDGVGIYRMNPDGSGARLLSPVPNGGSFLNVTPDGQWITFTAAIDGPPSTWRVSSNGGSPEPVAANMDRSSLSPDGTRVVGVRLEEPRFGVAITPVAGGEVIWVPMPLPASTGLGVFRFAADGQGVYFTTSERMNLWYYRFGAAEATKVTNFTDANIITGTMSPDGRAMIVSRGPADQDAFLIRNFR